MRTDSGTDHAIKFAGDGGAIYDLSLECVGGGSGVLMTGIGNELYSPHLMVPQGPGWGWPSLSPKVRKAGVGIDLEGALTPRIDNPRIWGFMVGVACRWGGMRNSGANNPVITGAESTSVAWASMPRQQPKPRASTTTALRGLTMRGCNIEGNDFGQLKIDVSRLHVPPARSRVSAPS